MAALENLWQLTDQAALIDGEFLQAAKNLIKSVHDSIVKRRRLVI